VEVKKGLWRSHDQEVDVYAWAVCQALVVFTTSVNVTGIRVVVGLPVAAGGQTDERLPARMSCFACRTWAARSALRVGQASWAAGQAYIAMVA
ncbi:hypothetical protein HaLaN_25182, partial [Haematococcus lacustris]